MKCKSSITIFVLSVFILSCTKPEFDSSGIEIPIEFISFAVTDIDLSDRQDWKLFGGNQEYSFVIQEDTLRALPLMHPYILRYSKPEYAFNYIGFVLFAPNYYDNYTVQRSIYATQPTFPVFPNITDQRCETGLNSADELIAINYVTPSENIKDAKFIHKNILIDFETVGVPTDAVVTVLQKEEIMPFNYQPQFYKAIVVGTPEIVIKWGGETFKTQLTHPNGLTGNTHYTFKVVFNADNKTLFITDLTSTVWSPV